MMAWLRPIAGEPAEIVLVCLPPGGGGSGAFHGWRRHLPPGVAVYAVDPPGRGQRIAEEPVESVRQYVDAVVPEVTALRAGRVVLVGVSLGGVLAFEVCRALEAAGEPPALLAVVAAVPPDHYDGRPRDRSPAAVRGLVVEWGLTDPEVLEFDEFDEFVLPPIAADLRLGDGYDGRVVPPTSVPVLAIAGTVDRIAPPDAVRGWKSATTGGLTVSTVDGGHFVHDSNAVEVLTLITSEDR